MTLRPDTCHDSQLLILLDGDEDSHLFRRMSSHVESCVDCQRRLIELSADPHHWDIQREMLQPLEGDDAA